MPLKKKKIKKVRTKKSIKKIIKKRPLKKKTLKRTLKKSKTKPKAKPKIKENVIGLITHYFPKVRAAVIKLKAPLSVGDSIKIKGHTTDFTQVISSMQIDRVPITNAKKGDEIGLLVNSRVRQHDKVCKQ